MTSFSKTLDGHQVRYDWYQTESHVTLNILQKNIDSSRLKLGIQPKKVTVSLPGIAEPFVADLAREIDHTKAQHKVLASKLEIRLPKLEGIHWKTLEGDFTVEGKPIPKAGSSETQSSALRVKDWDAVLKDENVDENDAVNALFQQIYSQGDEETRKAMNKSFFESGGTVLSTNWKDVGSEKVEMKPPDGMEFKKWDS